MKLNKEAATESVVDTGVGLIVNLPLTYASVFLGFYFEMSVGHFAIFQTCLFTMIALVRKYYTRVYFEGVNGTKNN